LSFALGPPLRRVLDRLDADDATLPPAELAQRLLSLTAPTGDALARRLLASALGSDHVLPERVAVRELPRLLAGPAAAAALERAVFCVVDLETTGLSTAYETILEIGAVRVAGFRTLDPFQTLVDPGVPIPAFITSLTGIDRSTIDGAPSLTDALTAFVAWAAAVPETVFVAHNASFDHRFVAVALERHGHAPWPGPVLCTRRLARRVLPDLGRYDLDTLSARFGIANRWRHRALGDAEATARALVELLLLARADHAVGDVGDLLRLQSRRLRRRKRAAAAPGRVR
jgi:DNA polymerase III epsilon subunit family exonuclease